MLRVDGAAGRGRSALLGSVLLAGAAWMGWQLTRDEGPGQAAPQSPAAIGAPAAARDPASAMEAFQSGMAALQPAISKSAGSSFTLGASPQAPAEDASALEALEAWNRALEVHAAESVTSSEEAEARDDLQDALRDILKDPTERSTTESRTKARKKRFRKARASLLASDAQLSFSARMVRLLTLTASQGPGQSARTVVDQWLAQYPIYAQVPGPYSSQDMATLPATDCSYEETVIAITQFLNGQEPSPDCGVTSNEGKLALAKSVPSDCLSKPEAEPCRNWFWEIFKAI